MTAMDGFRSKLSRYIQEIGQAQNEPTKRQLLVEFLRDLASSVFHSEGSSVGLLSELIPHIDRTIGGRAVALRSRRPDVYWGNLIFELKVSAGKDYLDQAEKQLREDISTLWRNEKPLTKYLAVSGDGIVLNVFRAKLTWMT